MLREYVVSEAMHALGIPTTRSLAVVATGRDGAPRDAAARRRAGPGRHQPPAGRQLPVRRAPPATSTCCAASPTTRSPATTPTRRDAERPYLALFEAVVAAQASLVARWMLVGFVHGVMNTDNMTISGETIDYGPCAFMDAFDPATVYSSIDDGGRYAYGNQPVVAQWNLARLAEALLPLLDDDQEQAVALAIDVARRRSAAQYGAAWTAGMRAKLGLPDGPDDAVATPLVDDLLAPAAGRATSTTRRSSAPSARAARGDAEPGAHACSSTWPAFDAWLQRWRALGPDADAMDRVNPRRTSRATTSSRRRWPPRPTATWRRSSALLDAVTRPVRRSVPASSATPSPAPQDFGAYRTFCGT